MGNPHGLPIVAGPPIGSDFCDKREQKEEIRYKKKKKNQLAQRTSRSEESGRICLENSPSRETHGCVGEGV